MNHKEELAEKIAEKHLGKKNFQKYGTLQKQGVIAAIVEAMGEKPEKKFTEVLSPQGNSYVSPNWWHDKPEEFQAEIIKHEGGTWGQYAAKTIYGNFALDKASLKFAPLWKLVDVRPYKAGYMMVEILRPQQNNAPSSKVEAMEKPDSEPKEYLVLKDVPFILSPTKKDDVASEPIVKCDNPPCANVKFNTLAGFNLCACGWTVASDSGKQ